MSCSDLFDLETKTLTLEILLLCNLVSVSIMYNEETAETASVCIFFLNLALFIITANKNAEMLTAVTRGARGEITFVRSTYHKLGSVATESFNFSSSMFFPGIFLNRVISESFCDHSNTHVFHLVENETRIELLA